MRRALGLLFAVLLAASTTAVGPHLVHHLFEGGHAAPDCPFASLAERVPADVTIVAGIALGDMAPGAVVTPATAAAPSRPAPPAEARAPPALSS